MRTCSLNNRRMRAMRKTEAYQAVMLDLYLIGALEKDVVEQLIGASIPSHLMQPIKEDNRH